MFKIILAVIALVVVGWYAYQNLPKSGDAVSDTQTETVQTEVTDDPDLEAIPSPATDSDIKSLESDINGTLILEEDFSNLE